MTAPPRRLLAISWDMPPQSGPRAVQVSRTLRELVPLGWHSDVVCFDSWSGRYHPDAGLEARLRLPPEVNRIRVRSLEERLPFRVLWRVCPAAKRLPDEKRVWIGAATRAARRAAEQRTHNVIVSFAQPWSDHLIGLRLHHALHLPWVAHFSDPWVEAPEGYARLPGWQRHLWKQWECEVIATASAVVFVNQQTAEATMRKYPAEWRGKVHVVPHGFDPPSLEPRRSSRPGDPLRLVYTGRFYGATRTPEPLLRAVARLAAEQQLTSRLRVTFVGSVVPQHRRLADSLGLADIVEFTGRVPFHDSEQLAANADVLLLIDAPADVSLFLPSKLIDYLPLRLPILGLTPRRGAAADVLSSMGYPIVAPDDEQGIAGALQSLLERHAAGTLGASPQHEAVAARYSSRVTTEAFARVLDGCAQ
jgi:glycosyltransferase involved in cell wall biosynthesis